MTVGSDILPRNATPLQRAWADTQWARVSALDISAIRAAVNPATCPAALLPWLAYALSVDAWDDNWSEATKRAVIAASPQVHRQKGTRQAVQTALDALGVPCTLLEWWEPGGPVKRASFNVTAWVTDGGPVLDDAMIRRIIATVRRAKPKSRVFTPFIGAAPAGTAYVGAATETVLRIVVPAGA